MQLLFKSRDSAVFKFGGFTQVSASFRLFGFNAECLNLLHQFADVPQVRLFVLPTGFECVCALFQFREFSVEFFKALLRSGILLLHQRLLLNLKLDDAAFNFVNLLWHAINLNAESRGGFVHQIDSFVWQKAFGEVAF